MKGLDLEFQLGLVFAAGALLSSLHPLALREKSLRGAGTRNALLRPGPDPAGSLGPGLLPVSDLASGPSSAGFHA